MVFVGIDPGRQGGIAVLSSTGVVAHKMPETEADLLAVLEDIGLQFQAHAMLEHVWSIPGQGGAFKFGRSVGHLEMALTAARIPFDRALPRKWQLALGVAYPAGSTDTEKKNITKRRAQALFPELGQTITHAIADALLIAEYCKRVIGGTIAGIQREPSAQSVARGNGAPSGRGNASKDVGQTARQEAVGRGGRKDCGGASWTNQAGTDARGDARGVGAMAAEKTGGRVGAMRADAATLAETSTQHMERGGYGKKEESRQGIQIEPIKAAGKGEDFKFEKVFVDKAGATVAGAAGARAGAASETRHVRRGRGRRAGSDQQRD